MDSSPNVSESPAANDSAVKPMANEATQTKAVLAEARATRDMLVGFRSAVESGTYHGAKMLELAKGLAFVDAILAQNNAHIKNLQERLDK